MSEARLQKLLVLIFILALCGMGLNQMKEKKESELETKNPDRIEQIHVDQEFSVIH